MRAGGWIAAGLAGGFLSFSLAAEEVRTIPQREWNRGGVAPVVEKLSEHTGGIRSLVLHHTQTPNEAPAMEQARLRSVRRFHMVEKGWGEVAYHYFIGASGKIYEGRDSRYAGDSGTRYDLDGRLLVCLLGDFSKAKPKDEAIASLVRFVAAKLHEHGLTPGDVVTHRMVAATDCPGDAMQKWFEDEGAIAIARAYEGEKIEVVPQEKVDVPRVEPATGEDSCVPVPDRGGRVEP